MNQRANSASALRPLNNPAQQRPQTSQPIPQEVSKENFAKFLNEKIHNIPDSHNNTMKHSKTSNKNNSKSQSISQLPAIQANSQIYQQSEQNSQQQQHYQQQNGGSNNNNQHEKDYIKNNQHYFQASHRNSHSAKNIPPHIPSNHQHSKTMTNIQKGSRPPTGKIWPQSAKSQHNTRPKSSQFTKPLIVHVEKEFKESQQTQSQFNSKHMSVYSREDMNKYQEHMLQDKLWDQVYYTKNKINEFTQANNDKRAKIWNIEKENRKMQKQIDSWGLQKGVVFDQNNDVFVDSTTAERVYKDENFYAITMKQQLKDLRDELTQKQEVQKDHEHKIKVFKEEIETVNEAYQDSQRDVIVNFEKLKDELKKNKKTERELEKLKEAIQNGEYINYEYNKDIKKGQNEDTIDEEEDAVEQLRFESDELQEQIAILQENNKVLQFEIQVQKQAYKDSQEESHQLTKKVEKKKRDIDILKMELEERGVSEDYNEYEIKKPRQVQTQIKSDEEQIEEHNKRIKELDEKISELNYDIQEVTRIKILSKQDNQKEIESSQQEIFELEEQYLTQITEYYKIQNRKHQQEQPNKSQNITFYGSDPKIPTISEIDLSENNQINLKE